MANKFFDDILDQLPYFLTRKDIAHYFGNLISPKYLANLDSAGKGPRKTKIGNKVVYTREDWADWLSGRIA